jgi:hypothetical protein
MIWKPDRGKEWELGWEKVPLSNWMNQVNALIALAQTTGWDREMGLEVEVRTCTTTQESLDGEDTTQAVEIPETSNLAMHHSTDCV